MQEPPPRDDRLDSWKEIAAYLQRDVTTAQRWERREGMPVHRHLHDKLGSVYAFRAELDAWARSRVLRLSPEAAGPPADAAERAPGAEEPKAQDASPPFPGSHSPRTRSRRRLVPALVAAIVLGMVGLGWFAQRSDFFWRSPIADAQLQRLTDFDGTERAAAISRDGKFVAFLSDRDGQPDVWMTQVGTGRFFNLTHGAFPELVNPSVRTIGFSADGALVTFWVHRRNTEGAGEIGIWTVPVLGGQPRPYLEGVAEAEWSRDATRLVYHTPGPGDPMFVRDPAQQPRDRRIFTAPPGTHAHFLLWSPNQAFVYFVQGSVPDAMDIWRIPPGGGAAARITDHHSSVSHPVMLNEKTMLYLASGPDGDGPWLHALDLDRRVPHRLSYGTDRYTSLAASADGRRLVLTLARPRETFWRLPIPAAPDESTTPPVRIPLTTGAGFSPRLGPGYLLYAASKADGAVIWRLVNGTASEVWSAPRGRIVGGPSIAPDGHRVAFLFEQEGKTPLYVMNDDGTGARIVVDSLDLRGAPAWAPDGRSITVAANDGGVPRLYAIALDRGSPLRLVQDYSVDAVWAPDGQFLVYSGPDIGTTFRLKAVRRDGSAQPLPNVTLTRGARPLRFFPGRQALAVLRGDIHHKDVWLVDLATGEERRLTNLPPGFDIRDFDISPDGREIVLDRVQEQSDVVLLDLPRR